MTTSIGRNRVLQRPPVPVPSVPCPYPATVPAAGSHGRALQIGHTAAMNNERHLVWYGTGREIITLEATRHILHASRDAALPSS